jgi:tRNA-splicing ligase RtcB (3'-phosphate/5'-hydroxy nucleic acid ligase)
MITGKILRLNGWPEGVVIRYAKEAAERLTAAGLERDAVLARLAAVRAQPLDYLGDPVLGNLARACAKSSEAEAAVADDALRDEAVPYTTWGADQIDIAARAQMDTALRLPISVAGALMPDAHVGYGVPIGAVLATEGAVIPYAVGVDIACRMRLSVYPVSPIVLGQRPGQFKQALLEQTRFGRGAAWTPHTRPEHPVLDDPAWKATRQLRPLQTTAYQQLGTSGTGNHFVEWGRLHLDTADAGLGLEAGDYLALLSHSGSRGVGFKIANYYSKLAESLHPQLDRAARQLAWLPLESEAGAEYWLAMTLAGQFAAANHHVIHQRVARAVGLQALAVVENHHNFAWRATLPDGRQFIVHRKGATPAGPGVLGVIPGSMADPGYVVRGRGAPGSLDSASHGAGRAMGRQQALRTITKPMRDDYLRARGVTLLGGGLDESPQAYKRIEAVMAAQADLVDVVGRFTPALVRMADEPGDW